MAESVLEKMDIKTSAFKLLNKKDRVLLESTMDYKKNASPKTCKMRKMEIDKMRTKTPVLPVPATRYFLRC